MTKTKTQNKAKMPGKTSKYQTNTNQNQNWQIHQTKLQQHRRLHKTARTGPKRKKRPKANSTDTLAINDKRQHSTDQHH